MKNLKTAFLLLSAVFLFHINTSAQSPDNGWTQKKALKWFKGGEWTNGMSLKVDKSVNLVEFAQQYQMNKAYWDLVFKWLKDNNPATVAPGKYILDSMNVIVNVTDAPSTKAFDKTVWEGHSKYIDLQYIARGKEKMGIAPFSEAIISKPYNAKNDIGLYKVADADSKYIVAKPGTFLLFFPSDAHRPNIKVKGYDQVKKIVFKIKTYTTEDPQKREESETKLWQNK